MSQLKMHNSRGETQKGTIKAKNDENRPLTTGEGKLG